MKKSFLTTLSVLILSTAVSAQNDRKEEITYKSVRKSPSITILKDRPEETIFAPNPRGEKSAIILCPPGTRIKPIPPDIIIDGEIISNGLDSIKPEIIRSITILTDKTFTSREAGRKGVILIKTKGKSKHISNREALVIINGVVSRNGVMKIDPKTVESISVIKDRAALAAYGDAGINGVVLVTTNGLQQ